MNDRGIGATPRRPNRIFLVAGLFVAFLLAGFVSGFASSAPDGLEKVAEQKGFLHSATHHAFSGFPIADYAVAGIGNERLAGGLAGVIGVATTFVVGGAAVFAIARCRSAAIRKAHSQPPDNQAQPPTAAADPPPGR